MNLGPNTRYSKSMHKQQEQHYATPPPSYTTSAPRSNRRKSKHDDHQFETKRLIIRGVQLVGVLLCVYRMWQKHNLQEKHRDGDRRRAEEWEAESMHDERSEFGGGRNYGERSYAQKSHESDTMYGVASEGSESTYLGGSSGGRRRRRERNGGGGRIEYGEYRD